jgi:hypothetical protein
MPLPGVYRKLSGSSEAKPSSAAFRRIALPIGCSEGRSAMAAAATTSITLAPFSGRTSRISGFP